MENVSDFPLDVVANASTGVAALRRRIAAHGLDTAATARLVQASPLTLARATKTGATPRGVLVGLSVLTAVLDHLARHGVTVDDLTRDTLIVDQAVSSVAAESAVAARMLARLCEMQAPLPSMQLSLEAADQLAA